MSLQVFDQFDQELERRVEQSGEFRCLIMNVCIHLTPDNQEHLQQTMIVSMTAMSTPG